jgi:hypothetical protein
MAAFAQEYWSLPPKDRRARWAALSAVAVPATRGWLSRLEPGLDIAGTPHANPLVRELEDAVRELFVLEPVARPARRAAWLADRSESHRDFGDAARRLQADAPELTGLEPLLLWMLKSKPPVFPIPGIDPSVAEAEQAERARRAEEKQNRAREPRRPVADSSDSSSWFNWKLAPAVLIFVSLLMRGACSVARNSSSSSSPPYSPPKYFEPDAPKFKFEFTAEEIRKFNDYERQKAVGTPGITPPPKYTGWILAGRPGATGGRAP